MLGTGEPDNEHLSRDWRDRQIRRAHLSSDYGITHWHWFRLASLTGLSQRPLMHCLLKLHSDTTRDRFED